MSKSKKNNAKGKNTQKSRLPLILSAVVIACAACAAIAFSRSPQEGETDNATVINKEENDFKMINEG